MLGASMCGVFYFCYLFGCFFFLTLNSGMSWFCVLVSGEVAGKTLVLIDQDFVTQH